MTTRSKLVQVRARMDKAILHLDGNQPGDAWAEIDSAWALLNQTHEEIDEGHVQLTPATEYACSGCDTSRLISPVFFKDASGEVTYVFCNQDCALKWADKNDEQLVPV